MSTFRRVCRLAALRYFVDVLQFSSRLMSVTLTVEFMFSSIFSFWMDFRAEIVPCRCRMTVDPRYWKIAKLSREQLSTISYQVYLQTQSNVSLHRQAYKGNGTNAMQGSLIFPVVAQLDYVCVEIACDYARIAAASPVCRIHWHLPPAPLWELRCQCAQI